MYLSEFYLLSMKEYVKLNQKFILYIRFLFAVDKCSAPGTIIRLTGNTLAPLSPPPLTTALKLNNCNLPGNLKLNYVRLFRSWVVAPMELGVDLLMGKRIW